ncbi:MAG: hypothetical protein ACI9G1_004524 [Pirellulaceae bacterium]|jgi:hypothetical protein
MARNQQGEKNGPPDLEKTPDLEKQISSNPAIAE